MKAKISKFSKILVVISMLLIITLIFVYNFIKKPNYDDYYLDLNNVTDSIDIKYDSDQLIITIPKTNIIKGTVNNEKIKKIGYILNENKINVYLLYNYKNIVDLPLKIIYELNLNDDYINIKANNLILGDKYELNVNNYLNDSEMNINIEYPSIYENKIKFDEKYINEIIDDNTNIQIKYNIKEQMNIYLKENYNVDLDSLIELLAKIFKQEGLENIINYILSYIIK